MKGGRQRGQESKGGTLLSLTAHHIHLRLFQANGIFILWFDKVTRSSMLTHYSHISNLSGPEVLVEQIPEHPPPAVPFSSLFHTYKHSVDFSRFQEAYGQHHVNPSLRLHGQSY